MILSKQYVGISKSKKTIVWLLLIVKTFNTFLQVRKINRAEKSYLENSSFTTSLSLLINEVNCYTKEQI